eukprot:scaffold48184_cov30-Tisochrysis_lutea.AAC.1
MRMTVHVRAQPLASCTVSTVSRGVVGRISHGGGYELRATGSWELSWLGGKGHGDGGDGGASWAAAAACVVEAQRRCGWAWRGSRSVRVEPDEAACQHWHDWARGPRKDDADCGDHKGVLFEGWEEGLGGLGTAGGRLI